MAKAEQVQVLLKMDKALVEQAQALGERTGVKLGTLIETALAEYVAKVQPGS